MTSEPRAWERPDGTIVVRDGNDPVKLLAPNAGPPSDAVPLHPVSDLGDEDPRVDMLAEQLCSSPGGWQKASETGARIAREAARIVLARLDAAAPVARDRRLDDLHAQAEAWVNENVASRKAHPNSTTHQARRVALEEAANTVLNVVEGRLTGLAEHYARQSAPVAREDTASPHEAGLVTLQFDPNVRVRGNQTITGYDDVQLGVVPRVAQTVRLVETESGLTGEGIVTGVDREKRLIYVAVDWSRLRWPEDVAPEQPAVAPDTQSEAPPEFAVSNDEHHCCERMTKLLADTCEDHPNRWDCPDLLVTGPPESTRYGLWVHDGGSSYITIRHCPWCGSKLAERTKLTDEETGWYEANEALGEGLTDIGMELGLPKPRPGGTWGVAEVLRKVDELNARLVAPDTQSAAPTRDDLAAALDEALFYTGPDGSVVFRWMDGRITKFDEPMLDALPFRLADVALGVLRGGGERPHPDTDPCPSCGVFWRDGQPGHSGTGLITADEPCTSCRGADGSGEDSLVRAYPDLDRLALSRFDSALAELRSEHVPDLVDSLGLALRMFRAAGFEVSELEPQPSSSSSADPGPKLSEHAEKTGRCSQCGKPFGESACGPSHASAACVYFGGSDRVMAIKAIRDERDEVTQRLRSAVEDAQARGAMHAKAARTAIVSRLARAAGVSPDSEDVVGAIEAAIRAAREPEVVTGEEAAELPPDSRVVRVMDRARNLPEHLASVIKVGMGNLAPYDAVSYRVLYRAPAPTPAPLTVGEVVEDPADLDRRATLGVVVRGDDGEVHGLLADGWSHLGGHRVLRPTLPARVLDVPGGDSDA